MARALQWFGRWFASAAGIAQTMTIVLGVTGWELAHPRLDEHGFWLLYALTIYSAVTQPVLAWVAMMSARGTDEVLARLEAMERRELALLEDDTAGDGDDG